MQAHACVCPNCGAPLPIGVPGAVEQCRFCGSEVRERLEPADSAVRTSSPDARRWPTTPGTGEASLAAPRFNHVKAARVVGLVGMCIGIAAPLFAVGAAVWHQRSPPAHIQASPSPMLALAELASVSPGAGWHSLTGTPEIVGSYSVFDPVANLGWARSIATAWRPDALPYALRVNCVGKEGVADFIHPVSCLPSLQYWFASRACQAANPGTDCALEVQVIATHETSGSRSLPHTQVSWMAATAAGELQSPRCTLREALAALGPAHLSPEGAYEARLERATWSIGLVDGGQLGSVDARTCATLPR